jgi:hypothetical protein
LSLLVLLSPLEQQIGINIVAPGGNREGFSAGQCVFYDSALLFSGEPAAPLY